MSKQATPKEPQITVQACHDRKAIEVCCPDDVLTYTVDEAKALIEQLKSSIKKAETEEPAAPGPLFLSGHDKEFADCGRVSPDDKWKWVGSMAGWELYEENLDEIAKWIVKVKKYIKENK